MYVCLCRGLRESDVRGAARAGCTSPEALIARLRLDADDCCGRCIVEIDDFVEIATGEAARLEVRRALTTAAFAPAGLASVAS
jgi:bacterioferritin-associated ferredoxin